MRTFLHRKGTSASAEEIFAYVHQHRPDVAETSIKMYLSFEDRVFIRVGPNLYELAEWGNKAAPVSQHRRPSSQEYQESLLTALKGIFSNSADLGIPRGQLIRQLIERTNYSQVSIYTFLNRTPYVRVESDPKHAQRKMIYFISDAEPVKVTPRRTPRERAREAIIAFLEVQPKRQAPLKRIVSYVLQKKLLSDAHAVYYVLSCMKDLIERKKTDGNTVCFLKNASTESVLYFPQVDHVTDPVLRDQIQRALKLLTIDNVDVGLFQLGKIFEHELKSFLEAARDKCAFSVTSADLACLVAMIDCVDRNKVTTKKHLLTLLHEQHNERAHGEIPDFEERKRLMQHTPFIADLYLEYTLFFYMKRLEL